MGIEFIERQDGRAMRADSTAAVWLRQELLRYATGNVAGRSFLISGHRGAGKTTLVDTALSNLSHEMQEHKLLKVYLHGPSLVQPQKPKIGIDTPVMAAGEMSQDQGEQVLRQVTIALYQRAADLFADSFRDRILEQSIANHPIQDVLEMAAQLRVELDAAPGLSLLRSFWHRIGRLTSGVLFRQLSQEIKPVDQGLRELVALASAAQAYRVVTGKVEESEEASSEGGRSSSLSSGSKIDLKDFINPLLALGAGGIAASASSANGILTTATVGLLTAVFANTALSFSSSQSRTLARKQGVKFLPDRSVASLLRMLPQLLSRFHECRVRTVFVVDELDKVPQLEDELLRIVRHMKAFFAEQAFFCFLTHREYMEHLMQKLKSEPYSDLHTAFTNRTFVMYRPEALHVFLTGEDRLSSAAKGVLQIDPIDPEILQSSIDREILSYALLQRSRMHPFDLMSEIRSLLGQNGRVALSAGAIAGSLGFKASAMMQVAIEVVLQDQFLADRVREDFQFAQLAYDALYYPSRVWALGERRMDLTRENLASAIGTRKNGSPLTLAEPDRDLLYIKVRRLIHLLRHPDDLKQEPSLRKLKVPQAVVAAFPSIKLLELENCDVDDIYLWIHDQHGNPFMTTAFTDVDTPDLQAAEGLIDAFSSIISSFIKRLPAE